MCTRVQRYQVYTQINRETERQTDGMGRDGTGRDGTGRDGTGRDGTGRDGTGRDGTGQDRHNSQSNCFNQFDHWITLLHRCDFLGPWLIRCKRESMHVQLYSSQTTSPKQTCAQYTYFSNIDNSLPRTMFHCGTPLHTKPQTALHSQGAHETRCEALSCVHTTHLQHNSFM